MENRYWMARNKYHEISGYFQWIGMMSGNTNKSWVCGWYIWCVKGPKFSVHTVSVRICTQELAALCIGQNVLSKCSDPTVVYFPGVTFSNGEVILSVWYLGHVKITITRSGSLCGPGNSRLSWVIKASTGVLPTRSRSETSCITKERKGGGGVNSPLLHRNFSFPNFKMVRKV